MGSFTLKRVRAILSLWLVLFVIWLAANGTLAIEVVVTGLVVTFGIAFAYTRSSNIWNDLSFSPGRMLAFCHYSIVFLREMIKSNLKVLGYVYAPKVNIRPGIIEARTRLKSPFARLVLSNTVMLTPGSLTLGIDNETVYIHGLDLDSTDPDANTQTYLEPFDTILVRTFG